LIIHENVDPGVALPRGRGQEQWRESTQVQLLRYIDSDSNEEVLSERAELKGMGSSLIDKGAITRLTAGVGQH
jgi:hypothetical protein